MKTTELLKGKILLDKDEYAGLYAIYLSTKTFTNLHKELDILWMDHLKESIENYEKSI